MRCFFNHFFFRDLIFTAKTHENTNLKNPSISVGPECQRRLARRPGFRNFSSKSSWVIIEIIAWPLRARPHSYLQLPSRYCSGKGLSPVFTVALSRSPSVAVKLNLMRFSSRLLNLQDHRYWRAFFLPCIAVQSLAATWNQTLNNATGQWSGEWRPNWGKKKQNPDSPRHFCYTAEPRWDPSSSHCREGGLI